MAKHDDEDFEEAIVKDDYDNPWKKAIECYFQEFMAFYFPDAHAQIDWSKQPVFLDQELQSITHDAELGKRIADKLVRVSLLNGGESWIYIHVEVQGRMQSEFEERIFVYNYRLYDRYHRPIASLVVLADENSQWKPTSFGFEVLGCKHTLEFPVAKLTDYRDKVEELLSSGNVFAMITAAHIAYPAHPEERAGAIRSQVAANTDTLSVALGQTEDHPKILSWLDENPLMLRQAQHERIF